MDVALGRDESGRIFSRSARQPSIRIDGADLKEGAPLEACGICSLDPTMGTKVPRFDLIDSDADRSRIAGNSR